jgi:hypothetical protein
MHHILHSWRLKNGVTLHWQCYESHVGGNTLELRPLSTWEDHLSIPPTVALDRLRVGHPIRCLCDKALEGHVFHLGWMEQWIRVDRRERLIFQADVKVEIVVLYRPLNAEHVLMGLDHNLEAQCLLLFHRDLDKRELLLHLSWICDGLGLLFCTTLATQWSVYWLLRLMKRWPIHHQRNRVSPRILKPWDSQFCVVVLDALNQNWHILETKRLRRDEPPSCTPEVPSPDHHLSTRGISDNFWILE